jgi:hypothetical protein
MEVHRCRFVEYQPSACNTLDFTPPSVTVPRLACGRANGNIEIWDPSHKYRLEKVPVFTVLVTDYAIATYIYPVPLDHSRRSQHVCRGACLGTSNCTYRYR